MKSQRYQFELRHFLLNPPKTKHIDLHETHPAVWRGRTITNEILRSFSFESPKTKWFTFKPHPQELMHFYFRLSYSYSPWVSRSRTTRTSSAEAIVNTDCVFFVGPRTMCLYASAYTVAQIWLVESHSSTTLIISFFILVKNHGLNQFCSLCLKANYTPRRKKQTHF